MIEPDNIYNMDCLEGLRQMEDATVDCCVTSPPYRISRHYVGFELSPDYHAICLERLRQERQQQRQEFEEEE